MALSRFRESWQHAKTKIKKSAKKVAKVLITTSVLAIAGDVFVDRALEPYPVKKTVTIPYYNEDQPNIIPIKASSKVKALVEAHKGLRSLEDISSLMTEVRSFKYKLFAKGDIADVDAMLDAKQGVCFTHSTIMLNALREAGYAAQLLLMFGVYKQMYGEHFDKTNYWALYHYAVMFPYKGQWYIVDATNMEKPLTLPEYVQAFKDEKGVYLTVTIDVKDRLPNGPEKKWPIMPQEGYPHMYNGEMPFKPNVAYTLVYSLLPQSFWKKWEKH